MIRGSIHNIAASLIPGRHFYFWGGYGNIWGQHDAPLIPAILLEAGLFPSQMIVWTKGHPVLVRKIFLQDYEVCFFGWREGAAHYFDMKHNNVTDVWDVKKVNPQSMVHLTEKPVELARRAILYSSKPHENVLDLFGGSGSTMMAAEELTRQCFTMEKDPAYCDVMLERWQTATGQAAQLEGKGTSFDKTRSVRKIKGAK
jgi:DNA modification methylase